MNGFSSTLHWSVPSLFSLCLAISAVQADGGCDLDVESLNHYELEILESAAAKDFKRMALPLACVLRMQSESAGMARYLSSSYLRPLLGGTQPPGIDPDPRYKVVARALEHLAMRSRDGVRESFVAEFARGDWRFYSLFCEQGNTEYCSAFLPDEKKIRSEPPVLAAASMMRLRKAFQVLRGSQRDLVAQRLKNLYRDLPKSDPLKRKFIEEIYQDLFGRPAPIQSLG